MAGGTWIDQNKVRPGVYINYKSAPASLASMGERGTVAIGWLSDWVESGKFYVIEDPSDCEKLGHAITDDEMLFVRQILKGSNRTNGAKKILVYALAATGGAKATVSIDTLVCTAKNNGAFGNNLSVTVAETSGSTHAVSVSLKGEVVEEFSVSSITGLASSQWIDFTGDFGDAGSGVLAGGANGSAASTAYASFLSALQTESFDVVIYDGTDATVKSLFADFVKSQSNNEGNKCQAVISDYASADNECVISVYPQSLTLIDGTVLTAPQVTWWVGGASAGANVNESLTYANHPDAADVTPKLTSSEQEAAITAGKFAFIAQFGKIQVLTDINTFTSFSTNKGRAFRKNRVVRTVFGLCNDIYKAFALYYIGVTDNDEEGRKSLKGEILNIMDRYQGNRALQNVETDDVTVLKGVDSDAVVIEIYCQPVDSIEKIYINITIS
jgi:hypothetical protein